MIGDVTEEEFQDYMSGEDAYDLEHDEAEYIANQILDSTEYMRNEKRLGKEGHLDFMQLLINTDAKRSL